MLRLALLALSLLNLSSAANVRVITSLSSVTFDEEELSIQTWLYQNFWFPNSSGHFSSPSFRNYNYTIKPGVKYPIRNFGGRYKRTWTTQYTDGTAVSNVINYIPSLPCNLVDADKFPRDSVRCYITNFFSMKPVDCAVFKTYSCINNPYYNQSKWKVEVTQEWTNSSGSYYYSALVITLRRDPGYVLQRIELPIILFSIILVSQLILAPVSHTQRLLCSVLIHIGLQLVFLDIVHFPVVGMHGGGVIFSNLVAAMLSFNFIIFLWSVAAHVVLENLATAPLPAGLVQLLDVMCDKAGAVLFIPAEVVKEEESKSFSRRGEWLKLVLALDRVLMLLVIVGLSICISKWLP